MIVVFGGAFNPPTIAHYELAKHLLASPFVDELILMPVGDHYNKSGMVTAEHRFRMLRKMVENLPNVTVSRIEIDEPVALKTVETLEILQKMNPEKEFAFVMGADNLRDLPKWSQHEQLVESFKMIIFDRDEFDVPALIRENFPTQGDQFIIMKDFEKMDISATLYRQNPTAAGLLLPVVTNYIRKHELYGHSGS